MENRYSCSAEGSRAESIDTADLSVGLTIISSKSSLRKPMLHNNLGSVGILDRPLLKLFHAPRAKRLNSGTLPSRFCSRALINNDVPMAYSSQGKTRILPSTSTTLSTSNGLGT